MARYGVSFVDPASDWCSALVFAIIYAISYYIGPRYNGTLLYMHMQSVEENHNNDTETSSLRGVPYIATNGTLHLKEVRHTLALHLSAFIM